MFNKKLIALALVAPVALAVSQAMAADTVNSKSASADSTAKIIRPIAVAVNTDPLAFGTIVRPSSGTTTVAVAAADAARTVSGGDGVALASTSSSVPTFTVTGEGGASISVSVQPTFELASGANKLLVTTTNTMSGSAATQNLSNALGVEGSLAVKVGGFFDLTSASVSGAYAGSFTVSASYN